MTASRRPFPGRSASVPVVRLAVVLPLYFGRRWRGPIPLASCHHPLGWV